MFAQIYFGGISSMLLSVLPKELEECFKNTFICIPPFLFLCCPLFAFLTFFCTSLPLDLFGSNMDFVCCGLEKPCYSQSERSCPATALPWALTAPTYTANSHVTACRGHKHSYTTATSVETSMDQVRVTALCSKQCSRIPTTSCM